MTRAEWYELAVQSLTEEFFEEYFGVKPIDIWALDYDFERDVTWCQNFEFAYQAYLDSDYECEDEEEDWSTYTKIDLTE